MSPFEKLLDIANILLSPTGCEWDRQQTLLTLQPYLLEETHELIQAIDSGDPQKICEELGDVFYALVFIGKLGEKAGSFTLSEALSGVAEKLIRRHPHVFGQEKVESVQNIIDNWETIKKKEGKQNPLADIPHTLPALARSQRIISKLRRMKKLEKVETRLSSEEEFGEKIWQLLREIESQGWDAESLLRRYCRKWEKPEIDS